MLDFGWAELILIIVVSVIVIGPNEIPALMVGLGRVFRRFQYVKFAISQQFDDLMHDADLSDIRKSVNFESPEDSSDREADEDEQVARLADAAEASRIAGGDDVPVRDKGQDV